MLFVPGKTIVLTLTEKYYPTLLVSLIPEITENIDLTYAPSVKGRVCI